MFSCYLVILTGVFLGVFGVLITCVGVCFGTFISRDCTFFGSDIHPRDSINSLIAFDAMPASVLVPY